MRARTLDDLSELPLLQEVQEPTGNAVRGGREVSFTSSGLVKEISERARILLVNVCSVPTPRTTGYTYLLSLLEGRVPAWGARAYGEYLKCPTCLSQSMTRSRWWEILDDIEYISNIRASSNHT